MPKKKVTLPEPTFSLRKKRLNNKMRRTIFNHLQERFRDEEGFAKADKFKKQACDKLVSDAKKLSPSELKVLSKFGYTRSTSQVEIPMHAKINMGQREITKPDGTVVVRDSVDQIDRPANLIGTIEKFSTEEIMRKKFSSDDVKLSETVVIPGQHSSYGNSICLGGSYRDSFNLPSETKAWVSDKALDLFKSWYIEHHNAMKKTGDMRRALFHVIRSAENYGELVNALPETVEIEADIFPVAPAQGNALQVVNDEMRQTLENCMKKRGVPLPEAA